MLEDADRSKVVTGTVGKPLTEGNLLIITKHAPLGLHNCTSNTQDAFVTLSFWHVVRICKYTLGFSHLTLNFSDACETAALLTNSL